ncbi:MAG: hypothetical protein FWH26_02035 [Oscillospiraceae bacterium]|nr:hypothetical protein [Oscillospiraceae bacterium]
MKTDITSAGPAGGAPALPEAEPPAPRTYDCTGCRYVDSHGLICDVCIRKILDERAGRRPQIASLMAACFDGSGFTLLFGNRAAAFV